MAPETLPVQALTAGEGEAYWWSGQLATVKADARSTGGAYTLVEIEVGPGYETPRGCSTSSRPPASRS